ncbi:hypothetical protein PUNSTDRAFT_117981, partial [Punctularia strigosozonata HHB-11173 SS5]|uniref:uncharacterized protein n=1 Tax=Punctularia strigosozonata (strain HHB-11173) TaxID=741275 RepID=UPI00044174B0
MEEGPSDTPTYAEQEAPPHAIRRPRTISRPGTQRPTAVVREPSYERPPTHLAHEEEELPEEEVPDDGYHPPVTPSRTPPRPGRSVAPTRVDREEVRRSPSGRTELESQLRRARPEEPFIPYVPTQPSARAATEALPGSEVGRIPLVDRPLSPVPVVQDDGRPPSPTRSAVTHIPPPRPPTMYDFPDRGRFDDLERNILDAARENEDHRERHFMEQEEARERIFEDNEARREEETAARRDALLSDLEQRFARRPSSILHVPPPGGEGVPIVTQEGDEAAAEGDGRQSGADDQVSVVSTIHHATAEAASRHAAEILEAVALERQQIAADHEAALNSLREAIAQEREVHVLEMREAIRKEREDAMREREEERERIRQELQEDRVRLDDDRDIRVRELEEELARVRA